MYQLTLDMRYVMAKSITWREMNPLTITMSDGTVYPVWINAVERLPSVRQERHFFNHSTMHQDHAVYPVDRDLRYVGDIDEDEMPNILPNYIVGGGSFRY